MPQPTKTDVLIIGAGAAGLMCAIEAGKRNRQVKILEKTNKPGKKILMSGGGRCNFTNYHCSPEQYSSHNKHFCKSALARYTQWDFIDLVKRHQISFHEKTLGQLFCDQKSRAILELLLLEAEKNQVDINLNTNIKSIENINEHQYIVITDQGTYHCESLVVATGGLSIPSLGSSPFAYKIAEQFGIKIWPTRAGLVPLTLSPPDLERFAPLSGISMNSTVTNARQSFNENILFTHRGLSGPAILQLSSYWLSGESFEINLAPSADLLADLMQAQQEYPHKQLNTILHERFPVRVVEVFVDQTQATQKMASFSKVMLASIAEKFSAWSVKPNGTEGYRTAEVTLGGIDCDALSSKTMEVNKVPGLYFVGEAVDVTGWLGGYNFQWAWSSGWSAGQVV